MGEGFPLSPTALRFPPPFQAGAPATPQLFLNSKSAVLAAQNQE